MMVCRREKSKRTLSHLVFIWTLEYVQKRLFNVFRESWPKAVLVRTKLVTRLAHNRVNNVQSGHFVLGVALFVNASACVVKKTI